MVPTVSETVLDHSLLTGRLCCPRASLCTQLMLPKSPPGDREEETWLPSTDPSKAPSSSLGEPFPPAAGAQHSATRPPAPFFSLSVQNTIAYRCTQFPSTNPRNSRALSLQDADRAGCEAWATEGLRSPACTSTAHAGCRGPEPPTCRSLKSSSGGQTGSDNKVI